MRPIRRLVGWSGISLAFVWSALTAQVLATIHFDIPAQPLADALRAVGSQTNINILFDPPLVAGRNAPALRADLTAGQALSVLLAGTGIHYEFVNQRTVVLAADSARPHTSDATPPAGTTPNAAPAESSQPPVRVPQTGAATNADQSPPAPEGPAPQPVSEVTVTGSRIARPDFVSQYPIVSSSAADLRSSAKVNIETALEQMPQFLNGQDENYDAGAVGGGGRATLNLRGLGQQRTLVLLDGRRLPPTDGTGVADLNDVPLGIIDNVQVISGGASAAYGSDAMAGVVNIITRNVDGIEISASHGAADAGFGKRNDFSVNAGSAFGDKRGHAMISVEYTERDAIPGSAIPFFVFGGQSTNTPYGAYSPTTAPAGLAPDPPSQAAVNAYFARYGALPGTIGNTTPLGFNDDGTLFSTKAPFTNYQGIALGSGAGGFQNIGGSLTLEIGQYTFVTVPQNRYSVFTKDTYDLNDNAQLYFQALVNHDVVSTQNTYYQVGASSLTTVPVSNPFIPADLATLLASRSNPTEPFTFSKRYLDFPPSRWDEHFDTDQFLAGANGRILDFDWNVHYMRDYSLNSEVQNGVIAQQRYNELLNAPGGGTGLCTGGFNPFQGYASIVSPQCYAFMTVATHTPTVENQDTVEASLGGKLFALPAGAARFDLTADWRRWTSSYSPDNLLVLGNPPTDSGGGYNPTSGAIRVGELSGEVLIPLLQNRAFSRSWNVNLAYRHSDYNVSGVANTYKIATDWRPVASTLLRGGFEHAIRAPDINDLFQTPTQATVQVGNPPLAGDPCDFRSSMRTGPNGAQVAALCVAQGIPQSQIASYTYAFTSSPIVTSGSLAVKPETADTFTLGAVLTPGAGMPAFEHLQVSLDYFRIRIADAIGASGYEAVLQNCYNLDGENPTYSADNPACRMIERNFGGTPGGSFRILQPTMNLGGLSTSGIDAELDWDWHLSDLGLGVHAGRLQLNSTLSWTEHYEIQQLPGLPWYDYGGTISLPLSPTPPVPTWRALTTLNYTFAPIPVTVGLRWRYIDAMADQSVVLSPTSKIPGVPAYSYLDLVASWKITDHIDLSGTLTNLTGRIPPIVDATAGMTQLGLYDIGPRTYLLTLHAKF